MHLENCVGHFQGVLWVNLYLWLHSWKCWLNPSVDCLSYRLFRSARVNGEHWSLLALVNLCLSASVEWWWITPIAGTGRGNVHVGNEQLCIIHSDADGHGVVLDVWTSRLFRDFWMAATLMLCASRKMLSSVCLLLIPMTFHYSMLNVWHGWRIECACGCGGVIQVVQIQPLALR